MVDVKEIAHRSASEIKQISEIAKEFIIELNGEQDRFQIEEVGLSDDGKRWFVTLSYIQKIEKPNQLQKTLGLANRRVYKRIAIDKKNLSVVAMTDWTGQVLQPV